MRYRQIADGRRLVNVRQTQGRKRLLQLFAVTFPPHLTSQFRGNPEGQLKSAVKIKESAAFLTIHSLEFLLKS